MSKIYTSPRLDKIIVSVQNIIEQVTSLQMGCHLKCLDIIPFLKGNNLGMTQYWDIFNIDEVIVKTSLYHLTNPSWITSYIRVSLNDDVAIKDSQDIAWLQAYLPIAITGTETKEEKNMLWLRARGMNDIYLAAWSCRRWDMSKTNKGYEDIIFKNEITLGE